MRRTRIASLLAAGIVLVAASATIVLATHCGPEAADDYNGSCESASNQVTCGTGVLPAGQPAGASFNPSTLQGQASVCNGSLPGWQGRAFVYANRPHHNDGGAGAAVDGDADNLAPLQGWYRAAWNPQQGWVRGDCGAGNSWTELGAACGPQVHTFPASCGPGDGSIDYNGNCEDGGGHVHCGTGMLPRGVWGQTPGGVEMSQPLGASARTSGSPAPYGEVSVCNAGTTVPGPQGRVYAAFDNQKAWAAYDGDPDNPPALRRWARASAGAGGVQVRCGAGDSFYETGGSC